MFEAVDLARLQFALTSIYHWLWQNSGANCS